MVDHAERALEVGVVFVAKIGMFPLCYANCTPTWRTSHPRTSVYVSGVPLDQRALAGLVVRHRYSCAPAAAAFRAISVVSSCSSVVGGGSSSHRRYQHRG